MKRQQPHQKRQQPTSKVINHPKRQETPQNVSNLPPLKTSGPGTSLKRQKPPKTPFVHFQGLALRDLVSTRTWHAINGTKQTNTMQNWCLSTLYTTISILGSFVHFQGLALSNSVSTRTWHAINGTKRSFVHFQGLSLSNLVSTRTWHVRSYNMLGTSCLVM